MGFLGKIFSRSFRDVDTTFQKVDEKISEILGIHGYQKVSNNIDLGNSKRVVGLAAPSTSTDAARYSDAMRSKTYMFNYPATLSYGIWGGYGFGAGNYYVAPCDMFLRSLHLDSYQMRASVSSTPSKEYIGIGFYGSQGGPPTYDVATIGYLWPRYPRPSVVSGTNITFGPKYFWSKGATLAFSVSLGSSASWYFPTFIADFLTVDR